MGTVYFKKPVIHRKKQTSGPALEDILADVARHFNKDVNEIKGKCMRQEVVVCRRTYCYIACVLTNASLREIGRVINKDHKSVFYYRNTTGEIIKEWRSEYIDNWLDYTNGSALWRDNLKYYKQLQSL